MRTKHNPKAQEESSAPRDSFDPMRAAMARHVRAKVDGAGRVVVPAEFRRALGWEPGETVVVSLGEGEVRIGSVHESIRRVQEWVAGFIPQDRSLSDELLAERRAEAARE